MYIYIAGPIQAVITQLHAAFEGCLASGLFFFCSVQKGCVIVIFIEL